MLSVYQLDAINTMLAIAETSQIEKEENEGISEGSETENIEESEVEVPETESTSEEINEGEIHDTEESDQNDSVAETSQPDDLKKHISTTWGTSHVQFAPDIGRLLVYDGTLTSKEYPDLSPYSLKDVKAIEFAGLSSTSNPGIYLPNNSSRFFSTFPNVEYIGKYRGSGTLKRNLYFPNVTDMSYMFAQCTKLKTIDIDWNRPNSVTNMSGMFLNTHSLVDLNLNGLRTAQVTDMSHMLKALVD